MGNDCSALVRDLAALTAAVAAALPVIVACTGSSTRLPADQCAAWVAWYEGAGMANGPLRLRRQQPRLPSDGFVIHSRFFTLVSIKGV